MFKCMYCEKQINLKGNLQKHENICVAKTSYLRLKKNEEQHTNIYSQYMVLVEGKKEKDTFIQKQETILKEVTNERDGLFKELAFIKRELCMWKDLYQQTTLHVVEIAKQPSTITNKVVGNNNNVKSSNNNVNIMLETITPLDLFSPVAQERMKKIITENYTLDDFNKKQKGTAQFTMKHLLHDETGKKQVVCGDLNRQHIYYKDIFGNIISDTKAEKIYSATYPLFDLSARVIFKKEYELAMNEQRTDDAIIISDKLTEIKNTEDTAEYRNEMCQLSYVV